MKIGTAQPVVLADLIGDVDPKTVRILADVTDRGEPLLVILVPEADHERLTAERGLVVRRHRMPGGELLEAWPSGRVVLMAEVRPHE